MSDSPSDMARELERKKKQEPQGKSPILLAEEHWEFIEGLFLSLPDDTMYNISTVEYLYKTAFVHGWKHCLAALEAVKGG